jgi:protein LSM14
VQARRSNPVHTAAASLETVERAIGDLRVSHNNHPNTTGGRGGRRGGRGGRDNVQIKVPATDFDFQSSNAKFDKAALTPRSTSVAGKESGDEGAGDATAATDAEKEEKEKETAYNPQKSFFDSLSSSSHGGPPPGAGAPNGGGHSGNGRGRRGGRGMGRNRREEEREKNVSTFGEPGGVGLMGPGAYVGGWGGYGRRGGRPRRGGPQGGGPAPQAVQARI